MRWKILNMVDLTAAPRAFDPLAEIADIVHLPASPAALLERIAEFDAYFASLHVQATRAVLERAARLRAIATASTGTDHIDVPFARERGIVILSLKDDRAFLDS